MGLYIKDDAVVALIDQLAVQKGMSQDEAVRLAVEHELARVPKARSARERLMDFYRRHPLPPPTGLKADKAFFDELSGDAS